jgi:crotonobetainyl-CoA:carnitine CoA-transferase CaiB-like acyl-CoA transferase
MGWGALQRLYRAADGWFFLGAAEAQRARLAAVAGPAAIESLSGADLECALDDRLAAKPVHEWVRLLTAAGIGAQPLVSAHELMNDPWVVAHGLSVTRLHWGGRTITTIGPPARLSRTPARPGRPAPAPGGDAEAVLSAVGMAGRLDELLRDGVIALEPAPRTPAS